MMLRLIKKASQKAGLAPGTMVHVGEKKLEKTKIRFFNFNHDIMEEKEIEKIEDVFDLKEVTDTTWINMTVCTKLTLLKGLGSISAFMH